MKTAYRRRTALKGERGYVLIMSALLMLPLLAFAGFAVDIGSWYTYANRMQRAADAAALAGVVWMPNDEKAEQIALETAKANGFDDAASRHHGHRHPGRQPAPPRLIHDTTVPMYFSRIFLSQVDIQRQALAEYVQADPDGQPGQHPGQRPRPVGGGRLHAPVLLAERRRPERREAPGRPVHGERVHRRHLHLGLHGDRRGWPEPGLQRVRLLLPAQHRHQAGQRRPDGAGVRPGVHQRREQLQRARTCPPNDATWTTNAATIYGQGFTGLPNAAAVRARYVAGQHRVLRARPAPRRRRRAPGADTTYIVRAPGQHAVRQLRQPRRLRARPSSGYDENVVPAPEPDRRRPRTACIGRGEHALHRRTSGGGPRSARSPGAASPSATTSLQVTSTADLSNPPTSAHHLRHRRDLRRPEPVLAAGRASARRAAPPTPAGISLFADGRLPIYVNQSATRRRARTSTWPASCPSTPARCWSSSSSTWPTAPSLDVTIVPPTDMTGGPIGTCTFIRDADAAGRRPRRRRARPRPRRDSFNGRVVTVQVPLPDTYGCNAGSDLGCWFKVNLDYANSDIPTDQTTWSARVRGDPVRLVE